MASSKKRTLRNLSESDSENEAANFLRLTVIKSLEVVFLVKFSFLIEKAIVTRATLQKPKENKE